MVVNDLCKWIGVVFDGDWILSASRNLSQSLALCCFADDSAQESS